MSGNEENDEHYSDGKDAVDSHRSEPIDLL